MGAVQVLPQQQATKKAKRAVNPWVVALTVTLATFMELLDTSIANVSLPHIAGGLGAKLRRGYLDSHHLSRSQCRSPSDERVAQQGSSGARTTTWPA